MKKISTLFHVMVIKHLGVKFSGAVLMFLMLLGTIEFSYGQTPVFSENFESSWTTPPTLNPAWLGTTTPANNVWHRNDYTAGWTQGTSGAYTPTGANSTTYSARFHTWYATNASTGDIITPAIDLSSYTQGSNFLEFYYINTNGSDVLNVYLSTNGGSSYGSSLATLTTATTWTLYSINLGTSSNNVKIKFTATSDYGTTDIGIDEVKILNVFSSSTAYTVPAGVYSLTVECWGGGGRGGSTTNNGTECGGGGGGAYSKKVVSVTPGSTTYITVGSGSTSTSAGGDSHFSLSNDTSASVVRAKGGRSVANNSGTGATGGLASSGKGDTRNSGGNGANGNSNSYGGGGGSSAGTVANGNNGSGATGGTAPTGGGKGGNGATSNGNGNPGSTPGGGGGGVRSGSSGTQTGGAGANGRVVIALNYTLLNVTPASLDFGYIASGSTSANQTYTLSGSYLTPASGNITVTAPSGFEVSLSSGSGFGTSVSKSYSGSTLAGTTIYVRFKPTGSPQDYSGNITNAGGGATTKNVAVTGSSLAACSGTPAPGNTLATPNPVCIGNSVNLSLQNSVVAKGVTYQWQSSPNNSTWTNITPVFINTDFSSQPANTNLYGGATISGGELILTTATGDLRRAFKIQTTPGSNINPFTATYDYRINDGSGADGMSMNYGPDLTNDAGPTGDPGQERGEGSGIRVCFDTYNNGTNSQIFIYYGGIIIWSNTLNAFNLRDINYRTAIVTVDNNGYLSLSIGGQLIVSGLSLPGYVAADKSNWQFKFEARTGGSTDKHSLTNLKIQFGDNPTLTVSPTTSTYYQCLVNCAVSAATGISTSALVTVNPLSVGGTASAAVSSLCNGSSTNINLSGYVGTIQWQQSADGTTGWANVAGGSGSTTATYTTPNLLVTTYYRAVVTSGACSSTNSTVTSVTVSPISVGGTVAPDQAICSGATPADLILTGETGSVTKWQRSSDFAFSAPTDIALTSSTLSGTTIGTLTATTYFRAVIQSGVCPATYSTPAGIYVGQTLTWNGSKDNDWHTFSNWTPAVVPNTCTDVNIPFIGIMNFPTISTSAVCKNLTIASGASLVDNKTGSGGFLTVSNTAYVERVIANDFKWHFLSSPVENLYIWPAFAPNPDYTTGWNKIPGATTAPFWNWDFYYFNPKANLSDQLYWVNLRNTDGSYNSAIIDDDGSGAGFGTDSPPKFATGRGYLVSYNTDWMSGSPTTHVFEGALNSGKLQKDVKKSSLNAYNLVGNPYPSYINWDLADEPDGWDRTNLQPSAGGYDYYLWNGASGAYLYRNSISGTGGASQFIAPSQGFFVEAASDGVIAFANKIRDHHATPTWVKSYEAYNNKVRLKLSTDANSYYDEMFVDFNTAYTGEEGTKKFWSWYTETPEIYSVKNAVNYSIDRYRDMADDLTVNISAKCGVEATYTITAQNIVDFSYSDKVILEDTKTGTKTDLKQVNSYSFTGGPSDAQNRFKLIFRGPTGTDEPEVTNALTIYSNGKDIFINVSQQNIGNCEVYIYDAIGRLVQSSRFNPAAGIQKYTTLSVSGVYIVNVVSNGKIYSQKVVIR